MRSGRVISIILFLGFLCDVTGLALAVHLHEAGDGHDLAHCAVHQVLIQAKTAPVHLPADLVVDGFLFDRVGVPDGAVPTWSPAGTPVIPRAPPVPS